MAICFECCNPESLEEEDAFDSLFDPKDDARNPMPADDDPTLFPSPDRLQELRALVLPKRSPLQLLTSEVSVPVDNLLIVITPTWTYLTYNRKDVTHLLIRVKSLLLRG